MKNNEVNKFVTQYRKLWNRLSASNKHCNVESVYIIDLGFIHRWFIFIFHIDEFSLTSFPWRGVGVARGLLLQLELHSQVSTLRSHPYIVFIS